MTEPLILATGFDAFPGAPENPSALMMRRLAGDGWRPDGARLETLVLPTTFDVWEQALKPAIEAFRPAAIVQFGVSARASAFTLERVAINEMATDKPDASGALAPAPWIEPLAAGTRATGLPLPEIALALDAAGLGWEWSDHAGLYICNLVFYRTRVALPAMMTGFVHLPNTPQTRAAALDAGATAPGAAMSEADMVSGVRTIIGTVAAALRARPPAIA